MSDGKAESEMNINGEENCTCGHVADEHGGDPEFPGSTKCNVEYCDCCCFELDEEEEEE